MKTIVIYTFFKNNKYIHEDSFFTNYNPDKVSVIHNEVLNHAKKHDDIDWDEICVLVEKNGVQVSFNIKA